jgi:hypothetical protein
MGSNFSRGARHISRWGVVLGKAAGGAVAASLMIGVAAAQGAHADGAAEVLGQAGTDLTQATSVLDSVPSASLDAQQASALADQENVQTGPVAQLLEVAQTYQDGLPAADQASPLLLDADQQLVQASQELLTADQGFLAAAQVGDLSSQGLSALLSADLPILQADLADLGANIDVSGIDIVTMFDPGLLTAF